MASKFDEAFVTLLYGYKLAIFCHRKSFVIYFIYANDFENQDSSGWLFSGPEPALAWTETFSVGA